MIARRMMRVALPQINPTMIKHIIMINIVTTIRNFVYKQIEKPKKLPASISDIFSNTNSANTEYQKESN